MYQSIMTKIKNYASRDWIVRTIVEHGFKIFSVSNMQSRPQRIFPL